MTNDEFERKIKDEVERCKKHKEKGDGIDTYWLGRIDALYFVLEILKGKSKKRRKENNGNEMEKRN